MNKEPMTVEELLAIVESSNLSDLSDVRSAAMCILLVFCGLTS